MKQIIQKYLLIILILIFSIGYANAQNNNTGINIQALTRDKFSNTAKDRVIYVQSTILLDTSNPTIFLKEEFKTITDSIGIFNISLGNGNRIGGIVNNLTKIPWASGPFFLNLKISIQPFEYDPDWDYRKDFLDIGTTQFGTVPYALYSQSSSEGNLKLNISDTSKMLAPYKFAINYLNDSSLKNLINTSINDKLKYKLNLNDSNLLYITPTYLNSIASNKLTSSFDSTSLSNRINLKTSNFDFIQLSDLVSSNTISITSIKNELTNKANIASPIFSGSPYLPSESNGVTQNSSDSSSKLATTEFVKKSISNIETGIKIIGPIAVTSSVNGATISGTSQLVLSPASKDFPGIVTTGDQTFSGNKTISGDFLVNRQISGQTIDQSNIRQNGTYGPGITSVGQSFTAGVTGDLYKFSMAFTNCKGTGNLYIILGDGIGGDILCTQPFDISLTSPDNLTFNLINPVKIINGLMYTIYFECTTGNIDVQNTNDNSYNRGVAYIAGNSVNNFDNVFNTYVTSYAGGNLYTSGKITSGAITYPNFDGSAGQTLVTNGNGALFWQSSLNSLPIAGTSTLGAIKVGNNLSIDGNGVLSAPSFVPYTGATGSVNLGGYNLFVNGLTIGRGANNAVGDNTALGSNALASSINNGNRNTAVGYGSMQNYVGINFGSNTSVGYNNMSGITTGSANTSVGSESLLQLSIGSNNTAIGKQTLLSTTGNSNTAIGAGAGNTIVGGSNNTILGATANVADGALTNATAIGYGANVSASNTIQLGNSSVVKIKTNGVINAGSVTYPNFDGTNGQILSTNGSGTLSWQSTSSYVLPKASSSILGGVKIGNNLTVDVNGVIGVTGLVPYSGAISSVNLGPYDLKVNGLTIGKGANNAIANNTALGTNALMSSVNNGERNTAVGASAMQNYVGIGFGSNTSMGYYNMNGLTTGVSNTSIGSETLLQLGSGSNNTAVGKQTFLLATGNFNTALGAGAGNSLIGGSNNTIIGANANVADGALTNATAIGYGANVSASNTIQLGNSSVVKIKTNGIINAGSVTYPNFDGTDGQLLSTNGSGSLSWLSLSNILPKANSSTLGGIKVGNNLSIDTNGVLTTTGLVPYSGATGQVNLGAYDLQVNGLTIGRGANSSIDFNTALGRFALMNSTNDGERNTAVGYKSLANYSGTSFGNNTSVGYENMLGLTTGNANTSIGGETLYHVGSGSFNTAIGNHSLIATTGSSNTAIGSESGLSLSGGSNNTFVGATANVTDGALSNATAIGYGAHVSASNTIQLGNSSVEKIKTSGTINAGSVTYPNFDGTAGYVLTTNGNGVLSWDSKATGLVPYTGATGQVNLGAYDLIVNGLTIGRGANSAVGDNTALGVNALSSSINNGNRNTAVGYNSMQNYAGTGSDNNTSVGYANMIGVTTGNANTSIGGETMFQVGSGSNNTAIGNHTLLGATGNSNTAIGAESGNSLSGGSNNTFVGVGANVTNGALSNATAIGYGANVSASNTIQLGNSNITNVRTTGKIIMGSLTYPNTDGAAGQSLTTDGNGTISWQSNGNSSSGLVPYTGATGQVNLGAYDLKVNGLTIGRGANSSIENNTALGINALMSSTNNGQKNTAVGYNSMPYYAGTGSDNNTSVGYANMIGLTTGSANTSIGGETMFHLGSGNNNTAIGNHTLLGATGNSNTAIGAESGNSLSGGSNNTFVGVGANVTDGAFSNATAIGYGANVSANNSIQLGNSNVTNVKTAGKVTMGTITYPNTDGVAGQTLTTDGNGTIIWQSGGNSATGLVPYTGATGQVDLGAYDLKVNGLTIGRGANNTISNNTALGINALMSSTNNGERNTAVGFNSMPYYAGTGAGNNTSVGYSNMIGLTNGVANTSIGGETMFHVGSGNNNTAIGNHTLLGTTGDANTAIGVGAGNSLTGGSYNTFIGSGTDVSNGDIVNSTAIGRDAIVTASNTIQLGSSSNISVNTSGSYYGSSFQITSDKRIKSNIVPILNGVSTIMLLNPVHYDKKISLDSKDYTISENGFIAQEIKNILPFIVKEGKDRNKLLSIDYISLIPILTKAIKEQQTQIENQQKQIDEQTKKTDKLTLLVEELLKSKMK